ncbi:dynein regulatory complex subunit 7 [Lepisosteus oculatus]|uniref:dynein regulatory complex subunit 7 n=1 Tax=Lepisosteus oculatus TaxID=7918 RepID=UPI0003EAB245|nr:PREDICTED: dynein regulatory complex subunit 7 [Lepisosteus oculatus]XP_015223713.1 PREDICTED: dynein regulatory complex subunit 7 [Lepisosteus oculatus]
METLPEEQLSEAGEWKGEEEAGDEDLNTELQDLEETLSKIHITTPASPQPVTKSSIDLSEFPSSYKENSSQEKLLLAIADNFRSQYAHLYPDRKPLFLNPLNECGVEKFVSTTLRPTLLSYPELYSWGGCACFVSEYLSVEPLDPPVDLPQCLRSPTWVLKCQRGTCFEFANLLCSLLLGAGYDAYCVSGYAAKELCLLDQTHQQCPLLVNQEKGKLPEQRAPQKKYTVKPPRDLRSAFEQQQEQRKQAEILAAQEKRRKETEREEAERERPPPDPLMGLRVHCWVLVLAGRREVPENFFIDPLGGKSFSTTDERFLGIESLWNHQNYWVNMQDCRNGCRDLTFDLGDAVKWEFLLFGRGKPLLLIPDMKNQEDLEEEEEKEEPVVFEMPPSWVEKIDISSKDMETRCPEGKKVIQYRKAKLEKFAPYLMKDGLVTRLTVYQDLECKQVSDVKEWFRHRHDHLEMRELKKGSNETLEHFSPGRSHALKTHRYITLEPETERQMEFYSHARVDGLAKRVEIPFEMTETFEARPDGLYHRHVIFGKRLKMPMAANAQDPNSRPVLKITERYHRNRDRKASEDVAERVFLIAEQRIQLTYHREDDCIIPSWREFVKPRVTGDKHDQRMVFTPDMVTAYQVDPNEKPSKNLFLYEILMSLMQEEEIVKQRVKESEKETRAILSLRAQEDIGTELLISVYDTARNEKARKNREDMERSAKEEKLRKAEKELDYLAPFLAQLGDPDALTRKMALQLREDCLSDLKQRLIDKANLIQAHFEKETQELQKKQQWYQQNQLSLTKDDEETYLSYCSEAMFRIHILELRLNRHKEKAPQKYLALEEKLRRDPRLSEYLW